MVLNNEVQKQENERRKNILDGEIRERQERRIRNVLERGLNKKVIISNTTFDEHDDSIGEVLEGHLEYDVDRLVDYFIDLIVMCGRIVKIPNGAKIDGRTIYLGSEVVKRTVDVQGNEDVEVTYYSYLVYPEVVESFLNDLENLDNGYQPISNNSILVGVDDNRKYLGYIDFSNCYDIDLTDLTNYAVLKYLFSLIKVVNVKKNNGYVSELLSRIDYNDFMLGFLKRITSMSEISFLNQTVKKGKVRKKKLNE